MSGHGSIAPHTHWSIEEVVLRLDLRVGFRDSFKKRARHLFWTGPALAASSLTPCASTPRIGPRAAARADVSARHSPRTHASALRPGPDSSASPSRRTVPRPRYTPPIAAPGTGPVDSPWLHAHGTTACSTIASASCCASASFVRRHPL